MTTTLKPYYVRLEKETDEYTMTFVPNDLHAADEDEAINKALALALRKVGIDGGTGWQWTAVEEV